MSDIRLIRLNPGNAETCIFQSATNVFYSFFFIILTIYSGTSVHAQEEIEFNEDKSCLYKMGTTNCLRWIVNNLIFSPDNQYLFFQIKYVYYENNGRQIDLHPGTIGRFSVENNQVHLYHQTCQGELSQPSPSPDGRNVAFIYRASPYWHPRKAEAAVPNESTPGIMNFDGGDFRLFADRWPKLTTAAPFFSNDGMRLNFLDVGNGGSIFSSVDLVTGQYVDFLTGRQTEWRNFKGFPAFSEPPSTHRIELGSGPIKGIPKLALI